MEKVEKSRSFAKNWQRKVQKLELDSQRFLELEQKRGEAAGKEQTLLSVQTDRKSMQEQTDLLQTELENRSGDREKISRTPVEKEQLSNAKEALLRQKKELEEHLERLESTLQGIERCAERVRNLDFPCVMRAAYGMDTWKHCF